jgi:membrane fusion protein, multidrug efflux system
MNSFPRRLCFLLWSLGFAAIDLTGCGKQQTEQTSGPLVVRVNRPVAREVTDYVYFTGRTGAIDSVEIRARVTGYLVNIDFKSGIEVKKNQRLFKIDPRPYQAQLDQARGQENLALARLRLARADVARADEVAKTAGAISRQDVDKYAAAEAEAEALLKANRASAEVAALNLEFTDVMSPVEGIVGRNLLTLGNLVTQDTTLLTTVVSQDPMYVYFNVDERTMLRALQLVREGKIKPISEGGKIPVEIGLANEDDDYPHQGLMDFVNNQVTSSTGTIELRAVLVNPPVGKARERLFRPGMFVRVRLPMGEPSQALLVPQAALGNDQGSKYLLVVNDQEVVEYRPIETGPQQPGGMQVVLPLRVVRTKDGVKLAGPNEPGVISLSEGDLVIVSGLQRARPGTKVTPKPLNSELGEMTEKIR